MSEKQVKRYRCRLCGYEVTMEEDMPADYVCPICGASADDFELIDEE